MLASIILNTYFYCIKFSIIINIYIKTYYYYPILIEYIIKCN